MLPRVVCTFAVSTTILMSASQQVHSLAVAHDEYFFSESDAETILWTKALLAPNPRDLKFLYEHWGDGTPPPGLTDKLGGAGLKPAFPWGGAIISDTQTTIHPKGSVSRSDWDLKFITRAVLGGAPGINGTLTAVADKANLTFSSTEAHTITDWSDPFQFTVAAGEQAEITVLHRLSNPQGLDLGTFANWDPDGIPGAESGRAYVQRSFLGSVSDANGVQSSPFLLQLAKVGTATEEVEFSLGANVFLNDGLSESNKLAQLLDGVDAPKHQWSLAEDETILLDFTWFVPTADYERTVELDLRGALFAEEEQSPSEIPLPSSLLLALAGLTSLFGVARRKAWTGPAG